MLSVVDVRCTVWSMIGWNSRIYCSHYNHFSGVVVQEMQAPDFPRGVVAGRQQPSGRDDTYEDVGGLTKRTVLVLNGAACFIGGRLASTGEPQVR